ncbi:hypothetical protein B0H10DRAFT_1759458, partial [Mycena sp. CBHHK59/15]
LGSLANALQARFDCRRDETDLDEAILLHREALGLPTAYPLSGLRDRFEKQAHLTDLDEAIMWHHKALALQPAPHPSRARCLLNLGISL